MAAARSATRRPLAARRGRRSSQGVKGLWERGFAPAVGLLALFWLGVRVCTRPIPKLLDFAALAALAAVLWVHWDNNRDLDKLHRGAKKDEAE